MQTFEGREVPHEVRMEQFHENSEKSKKKILDSLFQSHNNNSSSSSSSASKLKQQEEEGMRFFSVWLLLLSLFLINNCSLHSSRIPPPLFFSSLSHSLPLSLPLSFSRLCVLWFLLVITDDAYISATPQFSVSSLSKKYQNQQR